ARERGEMIAQVAARSGQLRVAIAREDPCLGGAPFALRRVRDALPLDGRRILRRRRQRRGSRRLLCGGRPRRGRLLLVLLLKAGLLLCVWRLGWWTLRQRRRGFARSGVGLLR